MTKADAGAPPASQHVRWHTSLKAPWGGDCHEKGKFPAAHAAAVNVGSQCRHTVRTSRLVAYG